MSGRMAMRWFGVAACLAGTALLGGCGGSASGDSGTAVANLLAFNTTTVSAAPPPAQIDEKLQCPTVEVLDGTASSRVYAGAEQTNSSVKYQFSMGDVARECSHVGDQLVLKVGVEGRALVGPVGAPGTYAAPVRIAVRREKDEKPVATKLYKIPVTIPSGEGGAPFSLVADPISVPFTTAHADDDYTIVVGFDAKGGDEAVKPSAKRRRRS